MAFASVPTRTGGASEPRQQSPFEFEFVELMLVIYVRCPSTLILVLAFCTVARSRNNLAVLFNSSLEGKHPDDLTCQTVQWLLQAYSLLGNNFAELAFCFVFLQAFLVYW